MQQYLEADGQLERLLGVLGGIGDVQVWGGGGEMRSGLLFWVLRGRAGRATARVSMEGRILVYCTALVQ
jgi:hypothetical protein